MKHLLAMLPLATDWATISSLATAGGTLVLAVATFASVRSANRSARIAEVALQEQRRPILTQSRPDDPVQKIMFVEQRWVRAAGGHGVVEHDGGLYFAISLRNVGSGIAVCQAWYVTPGLTSGRAGRDHTSEDQFRLQSRDLYIPAGDIGMWQGALRARNDPTFQAVAAAVDNLDVISVELLYSDQVGAQRTITRFGLIPYQTEDGDVRWFAAINRHWYLDRSGPRSDEQVAAASELVSGERQAAEALARAEAEEVAEAQAEVEAQAHSEASQVDGAGGAGSEDPESAVVQAGRQRPASVIPRPSCE